MKKVILLLIPLSIILAFFGLQNDKNLSFKFLLDGLSNLELVSFDINSLKNAFDTFDLETSWSNISNIGDFFNALGTSFTYLGNILIMPLNLSWAFFSYLIGNFIKIFDFVSTYIFGF